MTPTQAQTEARRQELAQVASDICHPADCKAWLQMHFKILDAALTAAAEVAHDKSTYVEALNWAHKHEAMTKPTKAQIEALRQHNCISRDGTFIHAPTSEVIAALITAEMSIEGQTMTTETTQDYKRIIRESTESQTDVLKEIRELLRQILKEVTHGNAT
jgi:hypothetical protein